MFCSFCSAARCISHLHTQTPLSWASLLSGHRSTWAEVPEPEGQCSRVTAFNVCTQLPSCVRLCDPMDCSPPGSSVRGILQARILEWVAISSSRGPSWSRDPTCISCVSCIGTMPPGKPVTHVNPGLPVPPTLPPTLLSPLGVHVFVLYVSFCFTNRFVCTVFLDWHICINTRYLFFSFWLTLLHSV